MNEELSCTDLEREAFSFVLNLSDGHAHQDLPPFLRPCIDRLPALFYDSVPSAQLDAELEFAQAFFSLAGQEKAIDSNSPPLLSYAASCAIDIAAKICASKHGSVHLVEPCFDSIPALLKANGICPEPFPEATLNDELPQDSVPTTLWMVFPNNPTGFALDQRRFESLVEWAASRNVLLVLDFCFRFFAKHMREWDQYAILRDSGVSFIAIEDTGKTWPLHDLKVGLCISSPNLYGLCRAHHDALLLNVSPVLLKLNEAVIRSTAEQGMAGLFSDVYTNRRMVRDFLRESPFRLGSTFLENVPFEWLSTSPIKGIDVFTNLLRKGLPILPGHLFYWNDPTQGDEFIRIPLSRKPTDIVKAIAILSTSYTNGKHIHEVTADLP